MQFNELNLPEYIMRAIDKMGFADATTIQEKAIPPTLNNSDVVGHSETGSGKTLAYGIAAVDKVDPEEKCVQTIIICPTRELALQVTEEIRKLAEFKEGCKTVPVYGGADIKRQIDAIKKNAKIIVGTPGRILDHISRRTLKLDKIKYLVLDEADEMLNMGFIDDVEKIIKFTPLDRQTVMFSATMPAPVLNICKKYMHEPEYVKTEKKKSDAVIKQFYVNAGKEKKPDVFLRLYNELKPQKSVIFCNTKRMVDLMCAVCVQAGINAAGLHGDMRQNERKRIMDGVKRGDYSALIATDVAARGIDIDDVEYVFNFDIPSDTDFYLHRIGRTGRAGKAGTAITLISKNQLFELKETQRLLNVKIFDFYEDRINAASVDNQTTIIKRNQKTENSVKTGTKRADSSFKRSFDKSEFPYNRKSKSTLSEDSNRKSKFDKDKSTFKNFKSENAEKAVDKKDDSSFKRSFDKSEFPYNRKSKSTLSEDSNRKSKFDKDKSTFKNFKSENAEKAVDKKDDSSFKRSFDKSEKSTTEAKSSAETLIQTFRNKKTDSNAGKQFPVRCAKNKNNRYL